MNQIKAARETVDLMAQRLSDWTLDQDKLNRLDESLQLDHLNDMVRQMEADDNPQGGKFSGAKLGRWLGWIQAAGTAMGVLSLEDCKEINMRWSD